MKEKLSVTVDEKIIRKLEESLKDNKYRNKSHLVEVALERFLKE